MEPPPPEPTPSLDEPGDENDENAVPHAPNYLVPVPYKAKHRLVEPKKLHNPLWDN